MAQLLFCTARVRKDTKIPISFLSTQVRRLDNIDWVNLVRVLIYIRGTLNLPLVLRVNSLSVIKWWDDAYFAAQPDCKGHTGAMMYIGS